MSGRSLLREIAFQYVRAQERYEQAAAIGNVEKMDIEIDRMRRIEQSVTLREINTSWRRP